MLALDKSQPIILDPTNVQRSKYADLNVEFDRSQRSKTRQRRRTHVGTRAPYLRHKENARTLIHDRLRVMSARYALTYGRVSIRDQRTRWGSCSKRGNLNFNYRVIFLPLPLVDLVVAHELCHLRHFHHGPEFWALLSEMVPDLELRKRELQRYLLAPRALGVPLVVRP